MTRVDFYVLETPASAQEQVSTQDPTTDARMAMVCKLAEKAVRQSRRVFIHTDSEHLAQAVDTALWDFRGDSFIPHCQVKGTSEEPVPHSVQEPVAIGYNAEPDLERSVLINLGQTVPPFFSRFERTLEVVGGAPDGKEDARERYRYYQQRGYPLHHHKL